jgi:putative peptidoglycan lipid II flippase
MTEPTPPPLGRSIASAAVVIGLGIVLSRILGLIREQVIAALFGSTGATSAFRTATRITTGFYDLLLSGATTSALVPVFSDYGGAGKKDDLSRVASTFVNLAIVVLGFIVGLLVVGAPAVVGVLGADPGQFELAVGLTRIALPSVILLGTSSILTAVLYSRQSFRLPALGPAVYNAGIIVSAIALALPLGIYGLAVGLVVGAAVQFVVQLPAWRGLRYVPVIDLGHPGVRLVLRLYAPVFLGLIASYGVVMLDTNLAWRTGAESVADMAFATTLIQFPLGLVGAAASLAILPSLSRLASSELAADREAFVPTLLQGLKMVVLLIVPVSAALVVLREPVVALLFQRLAFDADATRRTALALLAYSPQLPFVVVDQLLIVAFYARKETRTPVLVGVAGAGVYVLVALSLVAPLGMPGLALANAVQNSAHAAVLFWLLCRQHASLADRKLVRFVGRIAISGIVAGAAIWASAGGLAGALDDPSAAARLGGLVLATGVGVLVYALCLVALRVRETSQILGLLRRPAREDKGWGLGDGAESRG